MSNVLKNHIFGKFASVPSNPNMTLQPQVKSTPWIYSVPIII